MMCHPVHQLWFIRDAEKLPLWRSLIFLYYAVLAVPNQGVSYVIKHIGCIIIQCEAAYHSQGFEDKNMGRSPGLLEQ